LQLLVVIACLLPFLGMYLLSFTMSTDRREVAVHAAGYATIALAVLLALTLVFEPGPTCRFLSGHWTGHACRSEIGGKGDGS
jgi:hypothetical protein